MSSLKIYKASAGSGKTFMLTREYLSYVVKNPVVYRNILAVTFTNKATAEMKERILEELYLLANGKKSGHLDFLTSECGLSEEKIRKNASIAFSLILHDYSNFSVTTIDSFFQKIFRSFLYELGIKFNFDLLLNDDEVLEEGVKQMMDSLEADQPVTDWLMQFIYDRMDEGKSYKVEDGLVKNSKEIFKERFMNYQEELFKKTTDKVFMNQYRNELNGLIKEFISALKNMGEDLLKEFEKAGFQSDDFSFGKSGVGGYVRRISKLKYNSDPKEFEYGKRVIDAQSDSENWTSKSSPKRNEIMSQAQNIFIQKLGSIVLYIENNKARYFSASLVLKNLYNLGLLSEIAGEAKDYTRRNGYFLLAEIPRFLAEVIGNDGAPFVYEKAGTRYNHFMIDEFQDTSQLQYRNFKPLVENSLSQGFGNLVVGDVKQSIYRWRNSDWQLLASQLNNDFGMFSPETITLEENFRSKPNIISFNNALYSVLPVLAATHTGENTVKIIELYKDAFQKQPEKQYSDQGYVRICFFDKEEFRGKVLSEWLPATVFRWWNKGIKDIAVLVRENRDIPDVFNALYNFRNEPGEHPCSDFRVVSGESLSLTVSGAVNFLVALIRYSVQPDDLVNRGLLLNEYKNYLTADTQNPADWFNYTVSDVKFVIPETQSEEFIHALELPLYEMIEHFIAIFHISSLKDEVPFILNFLDCVRDFSGKPMVSAQNFLDWWNENGSRQMVSMNDEKEAVKIVSIHKSKGMQYEAVLIPFPEWPMTPAIHPPLLWCTTIEVPFNKLPVIPVVYNKDMADSYFSEEYNEETLRSMVDNINLLYVATTRAKTVLEMACPQKEPAKVVYINELINKSLQSSGKIEVNGKTAEMKSLYDSEKQEFEIGNASEIIYREKESGSEKSTVSTVFATYIYNPEILVADNSYGIMTKEKDERIKYGLLIHEILSTIKYSDEMEDALSRFAVREKFTDEEKEHITKLLQSVFEIPEAGEWFDRQNKVLNEIIVIQKGGLQKRPDRIVFRNGKTIVIDYKTGQIEPGKNISQVKGYMKLLKEMGYAGVEGWLLYTDLLKAEKINSD